MSASRSVLSLAAAALVAAVVSVAVVTLTRTEGTLPDESGRIEVLEKRLANTEAHLQEVIAGAAAAPRTAVGALEQELRATLASVQDGLSAQASALQGLEQGHGQLSTGWTELRESVKALNGRIEANYQKGRELAKRLEALEAH